MTFGVAVTRHECALVLNESKSSPICLWPGMGSLDSVETTFETKVPSPQPSAWKNCSYCARTLNLSSVEDCPGCGAPPIRVQSNISRDPPKRSVRRHPG